MDTQAQETLTHTSPPDFPVAKKIGLLFQEERIRQRLTLHDVADKIHIRRLYLQAIEEGNLSALPGQVYTIGFIKSYAKLLNLDGDEFVRQLDIIEDTQINYISTSVIIPDEQSYPTKKIIFLSAFLSSLFLISAYFFQTSQSPDMSRDEVVDNSPLESEEEISEEEIPSTLEASPPSSVENIQETIPDTPSPQETKHEEVSQPPSEEIANETSFPIILVAKEPSWVEIRTKQGKVLFMKVLQKNESYTVPSDSDLILNTGNAGGLSIKIGTETLSDIGKTGQVLRGISLTPESLKKFKEQVSSNN